jgi:hypothetical protein
VTDRLKLVEEAMARMEKAIRTLAWWLVEAQTGFAERDARGIDDILDGRGKDDG